MAWTSAARRFFVLAVLVLAVVSALQAAPPNVTYLYPAGGPRGQTVKVTAAGEFERWPVQVWVSGKGVTASPAKEKGKISVNVAADAAPGVYWLRLHDEQGASPLRPFVVGGLPEVLEKEPNDDFRKPHRLETTTVTINGRLEKNGDADCFALKLRKGQTLAAVLEANRTLASPLDGVLQVLSADGFVQEENNDERGLDPLVVFTPRQDGVYVVRLFAFPAVPNSSIRLAGGENFVYRLTLTTGGLADHAFPLALQRLPAGSVELIGWNIPPAARKLTVSPAETDPDTITVSHPQVAGAASVRLEPHTAIIQGDAKGSITLPVTVSGRLERKGDVHTFAFDAKKGQKLLFQAEARSLDFPTDPMLRVFDATGKNLVQVESKTLGRDPELTFAVPRDDRYHIELRDRHGDGGPRHLYRLRALVAEPGFGLSLATDRLVVMPGKTLDVPVTIERRNGFARELELEVEGLPPGVTAMTVPTGPPASAKTVTLRLTGDATPASVPIRIFGRVKGGEGPGQPARAPLAGLSPDNTHLWLTVPPAAGK